MDKEKQKIYERDVENFVNYTNEHNEDYKKHKLKLVREEDLNKTKPVGFYIFLGIIVLAGVLFYLGTNDRFISNISCNSTLSCNESFTCDCPENPCNCNCELDFPSELEIKLVNGTE